MNKIHPDLIAIQRLIYQPCNMHFSRVDPELESQDYGACTFELEGMHVNSESQK